MSQTRAVALLVEFDETIREVVVNDLGCDLKAGMPLHEVFASGAADKVTRLVVEACEQAVAADWELPVRTADGIALAKVSASRLNDVVFVMANTGVSDAYELYDELMRINNEQSNQLRGAMKQIARQRRAVVPQQDEMYEEMTKLANELGAVQRKLAKKNAQLRRANEHKDELLGMVAHDLRNPLGSVAGFSRLILRMSGDALDPRSRDMLSRIEGASAFMLSMVEDLLDFSAIESGNIRLKPAPLALDAFLADVAESLRGMAIDKGIELVVDTDSVDIVADAHKVQQVVTNLLTNGIKYSASGTTVRLEGRDHGGHVRVAVTDEGQGIPSDEQTKLFKPFGTTSVRGTAGEKSTGLGLAIARKVVEAHGGAIGVHSVAGEGSTFWFELPVGGPAPEA